MAISSNATGLRPGVVTSTTRPTNPYTGQLIFETDTFALKFWTGSAWQGAVSAPAGTVNPYAGSTAPTGWLLCAGQAVSRTTYADLFSVVSTTYGSGDGSTTFNLPDLRGRVIAGEDDMGGTAANRLTSGASGIAGTTLGAVGGNQVHTLTADQSGLKAHSHANTLTGTTTFADTGHSHAGQGSLHALIGATNGDAARIGYNAGGVYANPSTYSIQGGSLLTYQNFNHNTPVYGSTGGPSSSASVGISNATVAGDSAASAHLNVQPTIILNYIIKV